MRKLLIVSFCAVIFYSCGESNQKETPTTDTTAAVPDTVSYTYRTIEKTETNNKVKDSANLRKASVTYPVIAPGSVLSDSINNILVTAAFNNKPTAQQCVDSFIARGKDEYGFGFDRWVYNATATVINNNSKLFVLEVNIESYTGGAHGNYADIFYNVRKDGKQLSWDNILEPGKKNSLMLLNDTALRTAHKIPATQSWKDAGFWTDSNHIALPETFALAKGGLIMMYNHYEIAPYAMGMISYTIPYDKLNGIIKKEWLP